MSTGNRTLYIQIPDEEALHLLQPLTDRYQWGSRGPFSDTRLVIFPCYIEVNSVNYSYVCWQDDFPNLTYKHLEDHYHTGMPYTQFLEMHGITIEPQSYEYW